MSWVYVAILAVAVILAVALQPKPPQTKPAALSELQIPTAEEGRAVPVVFGTYAVESSNVTWYGDLAYKAVKTSSGK